MIPSENVQKRGTNLEDFGMVSHKKNYLEGHKF